MKQPPRLFNLSRPAERQRLIRELYSYLRVSSYNGLENTARVIDGLEHVMFAGMDAVEDRGILEDDYWDFSKQSHRAGFLWETFMLLTNGRDGGDKSGRHFAKMALREAILYGLKPIDPLDDFVPAHVADNPELLAKWQARYGGKNRLGWPEQRTRAPGNGF
jgi:hypothetical protein